MNEETSTIRHGRDCAVAIRSQELHAAVLVTFDHCLRRVPKDIRRFVFRQANAAIGSRR